MATEEQGKKISEEVRPFTKDAVVGFWNREEQMCPSPEEVEAVKRIFDLLPQTETAIQKQLRDIPENIPVQPDYLLDVGEYLEEEVQRQLAELEMPKTVPFTIYFGNKKFTVGTATVLGRKVHAQITSEEGRDLELLINAGVIDGVSVNFSTVGSAHPELPFDKEKYNFLPAPPIKHIPDIEKPSPDPYREKPLPFEKRGIPSIEGLTVDHTLEDEEPFKDKFPYGLK